MGANYSRRTVLRSAPVFALGALSGCSAISEMVGGSPPDVVVFNRTDNSRTTSIEVSNRGNGETVLSDTTDIGSGSAAEYPDALATSGDYAMTVETNGGLSADHEWNVSSEDQSMQVQINTDSISFEQLSP